MSEIHRLHEKNGASLISAPVCYSEAFSSLVTDVMHYHPAPEHSLSNSDSFCRKLFTFYSSSCLFATDWTFKLIHVFIYFYLLVFSVRRFFLISGFMYTNYLYTDCFVVGL